MQLKNTSAVFPDPKCYEEFPNDIWFIILSKLSNEDRLIARLVCHKLNRIILDPLLWNFPKNSKVLPYLEFSNYLSALDSGENYTIADFETAFNRVKALSGTPAITRDDLTTVKKKLQKIKEDIIKQMVNETGSVTNKKNNRTMLIGNLVLAAGASAMMVLALCILTKFEKPCDIFDKNNFMKVITAYLTICALFYLSMGTMLGFYLKTFEAVLSNCCVEIYHENTLPDPALITNDENVICNSLKYYAAQLLKHRDSVFGIMGLACLILFLIQDPLGIANDDCIKNLNIKMGECFQYCELNNKKSSYLSSKETEIFVLPLLGGFTLAVSLLFNLVAVANNTKKIGRSIFENARNACFFKKHVALQKIVIDENYPLIPQPKGKGNSLFKIL